jgi:hypothetical protein
MHVSEPLRHELQSLRELIHQQSQQIGRLESVLKDMFELSLLPEAQRRERFEQHRQQQLVHLRSQVDRVVQNQRYDLLEPLLTEMQNLFGGSPEAEECRLRAWAARDAALADATAALREQAEALMSVGHWSQAMEAVEQTLGRFPDQPEVIAIGQRIRREHSLWRDNAVQVLFTQVRDAIERREWRRALRGAEEMLSKFSDHPRGVKVVSQLATIRENAEIEERQEMEKELQQLVRARRFGEAIEQADAIITRYPLSPQSAECRALIPRLEELALQEEADSLTPGDLR